MRETKAQHIVDYVPGLIVMMMLSFFALLMTSHVLPGSGLSPLILALSAGVFATHFLPGHIKQSLEQGLILGRSSVLRLAIVLYAFNITFNDFSKVGAYGVLLAMLVITTILITGYLVGTRVFKLEPDLAILISMGSAICGAAAVAATQAIVKSKARHVAIAVSSVVVFGTLSMLLYPLLFMLGDINETSYGLWVGATVHEVAQVVVAASVGSENVAQIAIVEKMVRVTLLAPVLIGLTLYKRLSSVDGVSQNIPFPWFAILFLSVACINSTGIIGSHIASVIIEISTFLLSMTMVSLGFLVHVSMFRKIGAAPMVLSLLLFLLLSTGGYLVIVERIA